MEPLGRGNQEFLHCLEQQTLLLTPFPPRPGGKPRITQPALSWGALLLSPHPDTTQHSITPRFHDLLYALSATRQARGPCEPGFPHLSSHCVLLKSTPRVQATNLILIWTFLKQPLASRSSLQGSQADCLPDNSGRVTAQLSYALRSIQSLLRTGLSPRIWPHLRPHIPTLHAYEPHLTRDMATSHVSTTL